MIAALIAWIMMKLDILEEEVYYEAEVANAASLFTRKTFLIIEVILIYFIKEAYLCLKRESMLIMWSSREKELMELQSLEHYCWRQEPR